MGGRGRGGEGGGWVSGWGWLQRKIKRKLFTQVGWIYMPEGSQAPT